MCARCSSVALRPLVRDHVALPSLAAWHTRRHAEPSISNICRTFATKAAREEDAHGRKVDSHNTQEAAFETSSAPPDVAADASAALDHDAGITGTSEATLRKADRVFDANKCAFVKSCTSVAQLPTSGLPEVSPCASVACVVCVRVMQGCVGVVRPIWSLRIQRSRSASDWRSVTFLAWVPSLMLELRDLGVSFDPLAVLLVCLSTTHL